jgi:hypothetical protein
LALSGRLLSARADGVVMQASGNLHTTCTRTDLTGVQQSRLHRNLVGASRQHREPMLLGRIQIDWELVWGDLANHQASA